jgi:hypothetical protein
MKTGDALIARDGTHAFFVEKRNGTALTRRARPPRFVLRAAAVMSPPLPESSVPMASCGANKEEQASLPQQVNEYTRTRHAHRYYARDAYAITNRTPNTSKCTHHR